MKNMWVNSYVVSKSKFTSTSKTEKKEKSITVWGDNLETNHKFSFKDSKLFVYIHSKNMREIDESSIILNHNVIGDPAFKDLSPYLVRFVPKNNKISYLK